MKNRPNVLVFCVDQMQAACLGVNGHPDVQTPHLDALAARGVNFRRGYCSTSVCMPSRASIITGKTPRQHGLLTNGNSLSTDVPTLPQALADSGYRTHAVGKFHLQQVGGFGGDAPESAESVKRWNSGELTALPRPYYGYQTTDHVGGHVSGVFGQYRSWLDTHHPESSAKLRHGQAYHRCGDGYRIDIPAEHHYNHWIADRSIDFLSDVGEDPFFLFCSFPDPHFPFAACRPYSEMYDPSSLRLPTTYERTGDATEFLANWRAHSPNNRAPVEAELREIMAQTYGMISHVDTNVGRVLSALQTHGLAEDTIVMFIADHGEYLGGHGLLRKSVWPYDELWNIPFLCHVPGGAQGEYDQPVSLLDLVPTVLDFAGIDPLVLDTRGPAAAERLPLAGQSLRPVLEGALQSPHQPVLLEYDEDFHAGILCRLRGVVDGDWKLVVYGGQPDGVLFDRATDPNESTNLWHEPQHLARKADMLATLSQRLAATDRFDSPRLSGA